MRWLITYIDTYIGNIVNINKASFVFGNSFEMFPRNIIWSKSRQIIAFDNGTLDFFVGERWLF